VLRRPLLGAALLLGAACGGDAPRDDARAPDATVGPVASAPPGPADSATKPACPATGLWSRCAILERLDRSGLAPQLDSSATATEPPLQARGFVVRVGRGELEVYLYPDVAARERDQARLDRARYADYTAPLTMDRQPTLIASGNALAILMSLNTHLRERVGDAITAGAPVKAP
jgi:hypothetical protein